MKTDSALVRLIRADLASIRNVLAETWQVEPGRTMQAIRLEHAALLLDRIETGISYLSKADLEAPQ